MIADRVIADQVDSSSPPTRAPTSASDHQQHHEASDEHVIQITDQVDASPPATRATDTDADADNNVKRDDDTGDDLPASRTINTQQQRWKQRPTHDTNRKFQTNRLNKLVAKQNGKV